MRARTVQTWIARHIVVRLRLEHVLHELPLIFDGRDQEASLEEAARFSGLHKSQFSKMLKAHSKVAAYTLDSLSKKQAKHVAKARQKLKELPWDIALVVDSTLQQRASLHPENAKTFNHGQGFVVGHQWTNIVLLLHDLLIPLRPIPFYSQRYCRDHKLEYRQTMTSSSSTSSSDSLKRISAPMIHVRWSSSRTAATIIKRSRMPSLPSIGIS